MDRSRFDERIYLIERSSTIIPDLVTRITVRASKYFFSDRVFLFRNGRVIPGTYARQEISDVWCDI